MTDTLPTLPDRGLTDEQRDEITRVIGQFAASVQTIVDAVMPALLAGLQAAAQQFAALQEQLQTAGVLDAEGKPVRPADRPAWQTPYGPPTRRH